MEANANPEEVKSQEPHVDPKPEEKVVEEKKEEVEEEKTETVVEAEPVAEAKVEETPVEEVKKEEVEEEEVKPAEAVVEETPIAEVTEPEQKPVVEVAAPEEFDWDAVGKKQEHYTSDERVKLEELYDKTFSSIAEQEVVEGTIVGLNDREIVVNINFKSDGVLPRAEVRYNPDIKLGDGIEVYVESQEDQNGQLILSHKKARILKSWERVNEAYEKEEVIKGYVKSRTKGGLIVDVFGIEAFLPGSQIDVKPIRDYDVFVDKVMEFKVVKINHEYKNVVVSHKALIERELEQQKAEIIAKLEKRSGS